MTDSLPTPTFAVIGLGRFGLFWAEHISRYFPVSVWDVDNKKEAAVGSFARWEKLKVCLQKSFIFLTLPISRIEPFLNANKKDFSTGSVLIDCASVKKPVLEWFDVHLPGDVYYVASHPLFGPDSAKRGLVGHTIVLIPGRIPLRLYEVLVRLFDHDMRLRVQSLDPVDHDRMMAYNLCFVHHLGRAIHQMNLHKLPVQMSGLVGLRNLSAVTLNDSDELFYDFHRFNPFADEIREQFLSSFSELTARIKKEN